MNSKRSLLDQQYCVRINDTYISLSGLEIISSPSSTAPFGRGGRLELALNGGMVAALSPRFDSSVELFEPIALLTADEDTEADVDIPLDVGEVDVVTDDEELDPVVLVVVLLLVVVPLLLPLCVFLAMLSSRTELLTLSLLSDGTWTRVSRSRSAPLS